MKEWGAVGWFLLAGAARAALPWSEPGAPALMDDAPVMRITAETLGKTLPRNGGRLVRRESFTILAIGDSVTATGPYPEILTQLLERATGNKSITVVRAAYPGKGTDAAVRRWWRDIEPVDPQLALIMFGLNDQAAGVPVAAYQEQMRWLVDRLRSEDDADVVLLEPTPHIDITPLADAKTPPPPEASVFRTAGFGAALRETGAELGVPVAPTFDALWGNGGVNLQEAARRMWPLFPRSYKEPFTTLVETGGRGDTIHPNARGHLALARAVFTTLAGRPRVPPLHLSGETRMENDGWSGRLTVKNLTEESRSGRLALYPFAGEDLHENHDYLLKAGESIDLEFTWPANRVESCLQVVDYHDGGSRVEAVRLTSGEGWEREHLVVADGLVVLRKKAGGLVKVELPKAAAVGRIPLTGGGELAFVRHARATEGEAVLDGVLNDWGDAEWVPVGEEVQARSVRGVIRDLRATSGECYLRWSFRAGREGVYFAFRGSGDLSNDRFTVLLDPRGPEELGSAGPYYWVDGAMKPGGAIALKAGDSSRTSEGLYAAWRDAGREITEAELFVPYEVMHTMAWPASGDLGLSIVWMHRHPGGQTTRLVWSEDGYAWTPRWFGVVRRGGGELPWRVRIK